MSTLATKLVGALRIEEGTSLWITDTSESAAADTEVALTAGLYYVLGDGSSDDLLDHIETQVNTALAGITTTPLTISWTVDGDGLVSHVVDQATETVDLQWDAPGGQTDEATDVQEWLRLEDQGASYQLTDTSITGYRTHSYSLYPTHYLQIDLRPWEARSEQLVPDNGNPQTLKLPRRQQYRLGLRTAGFPRGSGFNEYHEAEDLHDHMMSGRPFRVYPDTNTTTAAYSDSFGGTNRYGYEEMIAVPFDLDPEPTTQSYYKHMDTTFTAYKYTP